MFLHEYTALSQVTQENHLGGLQDIHSQLSSCNLHVCVSMGYFDRSMLHATVVVILKKEKWAQKQWYGGKDTFSFKGHSKGTLTLTLNSERVTCSLHSKHSWGFLYYITPLSCGPSWGPEWRKLECGQWRGKLKRTLQRRIAHWFDMLLHPVLKCNLHDKPRRS